jgi:hypothetical protein
MKSLLLASLALLTVLPFQLRAENGNVRVNGRVQLRADVDVPFSADAPIPGPAPTVTDPPPVPGPVTTQPPVYQYSEPVYQHEYVPQFQTRIRYRLRLQPARFYYQPYVAYEPVPQQFAVPCLDCPTGLSLLGGRRERLDIRYRYRSGW